MPHLLVDETTPVLVDYGFWTLDDLTGDHSPMPARGDDFMVAGSNVVHFFSPVQDQEATLELEVWDGPPAPPPGAWEERSEGTARFDTGVLAPNVLKDDDDRIYVDLPAPGAYGVRCCRRGTARLRADYSGLLDVEDWPVGVEVYRVQLWPTGD